MKVIGGFIVGTVAGVLAGWVTFPAILSWAERAVTEHARKQAEIEMGNHLRLIDGGKQ